MSIRTWKKQRHAQGTQTYSQEEMKQQVAGNTVICPENTEVMRKKMTGYLRQC